MSVSNRWRSGGGLRALLHSRPFLTTLPFVAVIVLAAVLSFVYHELLRRQRDSVEHTYRVITALEATSSRIVDAETGQRGYVITGDTAYLAPYRRALVEIPASLRELRALTADNPAQLRREEALSASLTAKLQELQQTIDARNAGGLAAARDVVMRDRGRILMDEARATVAQMRAAESGLLRQRSGEAQATERRLLVITVVCALLSLAARVALAVVARSKDRA